MLMGLEIVRCAPLEKLYMLHTKPLRRPLLLWRKSEKKTYAISNPHQMTAPCGSHRLTMTAQPPSVPAASFSALFILIINIFLPLFYR